MKRGQSSQYVLTNLQAISDPFVGWQDQSLEVLTKIRTTIMICKFYITGAAKATHKSSHDIREFPQPALSPSCQAWSSGFLRGINLGEWLVRFFLQIAQKNFEYPFVPFWWEILHQYPWIQLSQRKYGKAWQFSFGWYKEPLYMTWSPLIWNNSWS